MPDASARDIEVVGQLGRGGHTVTYRVRSDGAEYAMKVLRLGAGALDEERAFRREAALLAAVDYPGIARVHEVGRWHGDPYLLMDLSRERSSARCSRTVHCRYRSCCRPASTSRSPWSPRTGPGSSTATSSRTTSSSARTATPGSSTSGSRRAAASSRRRRRRHAALLRAGTGRHAQPPGRRPGRPLRAGDGALRVRDRAAAVRQRPRRRAVAQARHHPAAEPAYGAPRPPARGRGDHRPVAGQGSR